MEDDILTPALDDVANGAPEETNEEELSARQPAPEPLHRARAAQRGYYRWRRLSRLALAAFVIVAVVTLVWLMPWMGIGLNASDYTPQLAFTIYLLGGAAISALLVLGFRELAQRDRELLLVWAGVFDEATGLHNRTYFQDRLDLECARGHITREPFSVIVLQFLGLGPSGRSGRRTVLSAATLQGVADKVNRFIRRRDLVALFTVNEIVVLAMGVAPSERLELERRLHTAISASLPEHGRGPANIVLRIGGATYGPDGTYPGPLIQAARTAAGFGTLQHIKSA